MTKDDDPSRTKKSPDAQRSKVADAVAGGVWGLLVGDALGVPYEFRAPSELLPFDELEMPPPAHFARSHPRAPREAWSDDGAHALCLLASLLDRDTPL